MMQVTISGKDVTIDGNIKSVSNFQELKSIFDELIETHRSINIKISDSLSITSSVIGYFNKLILKDKIDISMSIGNEQLMELLYDLELVTLFKARRL